MTYIGLLHEKWKKVSVQGRNASPTSIYFAFWMTLILGTCQIVSITILGARFHKIHDFFFRVGTKVWLNVTLPIAHRPHSLFNAYIRLVALKQLLQFKSFSSKYYSFQHFTVISTDVQFYTGGKNTELERKIECVIADSINYLLLSVYLYLFNDFNCHPFWSLSKTAIRSTLILRYTSFSDMIFN